MYKIDKNIPIPPRKHQGNPLGHRDVYPFAELRPGDSFLIPTDNSPAGNQIARNRAGATFRRSRHAHRYKIVTRNVKGGVRVWREPEGKTEV